MERPIQTQESVSEALSSVIDAGHQLLAERLELAIIESRQYAGHLAVRISFVFLGGLVLLGGLLTVDIALVDRARAGAPGSLALFYCAALHGAIGAVLLGLGLRHRPSGTSR